MTINLMIQSICHVKIQLNDVIKVSVGILHLYSYQYNVTSAKTALILILCQYWCITSMYMHAHHCKHICKLLRMMHYYVL